MALTVPRGATSLHTTSRLLSLSADAARSRAESNIFVNEPTSGSLARSRGSLYIVTETQGDTPLERAFCRLVADAIRGEYYRDATQELEEALSRGLERGNAKMLADDRLPALEERPVVAVTCLAARDGELAVVQTLPVQTYLGTRDGIALIPDPPPWEADSVELTPAYHLGFGPQVRYHLYTAKLADGDMVAVCSSALAQSLSLERLEGWLTSGETRVLTQGLRSHYLSAEREPAYALVVQARPDIREKASAAPEGAPAPTRPRPPFPFGLPAPALPALGPRPDASAAPSGGAPASGTARSSRTAVGTAAAAPSGTESRRTAAPASRPERPAAPGRSRRPARRARASARLPVAALVIGLLLLLLLVLAVKGVQRFQAGREHSALAQTSAQVDTLLAAAAQQQDPTAAAAKLQQADTVVSANAQRLNAADRQALLARVQGRVDQLVKASRLGTVKLLADFSGDRQAQLAALAVDGDNVYMLDTGGRRVLKVTTANSKPLEAIKAGAVVGKDVVAPLVAIAAVPGGVLAVDSRNTVWSFDAAKNDVHKVQIPGAESWGEVRAITTYKNELYVLDAKRNAVLRYTPQGDGYGPPADYFAAAAPQAAAAAATPGATPSRRRATATAVPTPLPAPTPAPPDLAHSADLAVDGSLYLLQSDGSVLKYTNGLPDPFPETGLVGRMPSPSRILANPQDSSVYVVDPSGKRLVRFSKSGAFQRQYLLPADAPGSLTGIRSAEVAPNGQVYLLSDKAVAAATLPNE